MTLDEMMRKLKSSNPVIATGSISELTEDEMLLVSGGSKVLGNSQLPRNGGNA